MSDRNGEAVGDVVWFWRGLQPQELGDHELHLLFIGGAIAHNRLLDFGRAVLGPGDSVLLGCEENHPEGLSNIHGGGFVLSKELPLGRDGVGFIGIQQLCHLIVDEAQTVCQYDLRGLDQTIVNWSNARTFHADDAAANPLKAWVNAENDQSFPAKSKATSSTLKPLEKLTFANRNRNRPPVGAEEWVLRKCEVVKKLLHLSKT